jgi:hypothetical protein
MMFRYLLMTLFLIFGLVACSPTASNVAEPPAAEPTETPHDDPEHEAGAEEESADQHEEEGDEHRESGAHEHGAATLTVAWSGNEMEIELDTPAFNLFGFEYEPSSAEDIQIVDDAVHDLESGDLLIVNVEAVCVLANADISTAWDEEGAHADEADHDEEGETHADEAAHEDEGETHSDVQAAVSLVCDSPDDIRSLDLSPLFDRFPNLAELDAQWISDTGQSGAELTAESPQLSLR